MNQVFVYVFIRLRVQFGIYLNTCDLQKVSKLHEPVRRMQLDLLERHMSAN